MREQHYSASIHSKPSATEPSSRVKHTAMRRTGSPYNQLFHKNPTSTAALQNTPVEGRIPI
jgi:hypothetical protein